MPTVQAVAAKTKQVQDPCAAYESVFETWRRNRAVCEGERSAKAYDAVLDTVGFRNLLIPFSNTMRPEQYSFYLAEAELPGITAQFARTLIGGLLRKEPVLELPESVPSEVTTWLKHEIAKDSSSMTSFLDSALWEEVQTNRCWVFVDYPVIDDPSALTQQEMEEYRPFVVMYKAESIINWRTRDDGLGRKILDMVLVRGLSEEFYANEFHPTYRDTVWVHELDEDGLYRVRTYKRRDETSSATVTEGSLDPQIGKAAFDLTDVNDTILMGGERLNFIPAWPLNGNVDITRPVLSPFIDKEVALYNKMSRRNHLLYGAATYTPIVHADISDEEFEQIVGAGLGSWMKLPSGSSAGVLETPTAALADMDRAIAASIEEIARLGVRMLAPEADQSGAALQIRNAAQNASLGSLNQRVSATMRQILSFMIEWRFGVEVPETDIKFSMSADFDPAPVGEGWLRLATEWYQQGLIPRSVWLVILKTNDMLPPDYDDEAGRDEITADQEIQAASDRSSYSADLAAQQEAADSADPEQAAGTKQTAGGER